MPTPPLPEWAPHEAVWIGFPSDPELWLGDLKPAEREVAAFAEAVHAGGKGEQVRIVAAHEDAAEAARGLAPFAEVIVEPFGDIWLRDTGPIVTGSGKGRRAVGFGFNGWGGKMSSTATRTSASGLPGAGLPFAKADWVLEGGAIDHDGVGHRDHHRAMPAQSQPQQSDARGGREAPRARPRLRARVWLGAGLANDHTDGHIDNLARFIAPGRVAIPSRRHDDPNEAVYRDARAAALATPARRRHPPLARPDPRRGRRHRSGELHELLHRQRRGRGAAIWRFQRRAALDPSRRCSPTALQSGFAPTIS